MYHASCKVGIILERYEPELNCPDKFHFRHSIPNFIEIRLVVLEMGHAAEPVPVISDPALYADKV
jgi:hypothetical protein